MLKFLLIVSAIIGLVGVYLLRACRIVVTGPEDAYNTCDGPGGAISQSVAQGLGLICITAAVAITSIVLLIRKTQYT